MKSRKFNQTRSIITDITSNCSKRWSRWLRWLDVLDTKLNVMLRMLISELPKLRGKFMKQKSGQLSLSIVLSRPKREPHVSRSMLRKLISTFKRLSTNGSLPKGKPESMEPS